MNDFSGGICEYDPYFRCHHYGELTFSIFAYAYSEDFVLVFSHDEVVSGKGSMAGKIAGRDPGGGSIPISAHWLYDDTSGKKLLFMGQDFGQSVEWNEAESRPLGSIKRY